jgi:hypothetical protein
MPVNSGNPEKSITHNDDGREQSECDVYAIIPHGVLNPNYLVSVMIRGVTDCVGRYFQKLVRCQIVMSNAIDRVNECRQLTIFFQTPE